MIIGKKVKQIVKKGKFVSFKSDVVLTPGQSLRIIREWQGLSQNELARISGFPQSTLSGMESGRISIGVERAKVLARVLKVHPAVIVFPSWDANQAA